MSDRRVAVIGVGNVLCQDEGVGVHLARALQSCDLPAGVEVIDAGTALLDVLLDTADCQKIVIVDAVAAGGEPGAIYRIPLEELSTDVEQAATSLHELSLLGTLNLSRLQLQRLPEIVLIGVEPQAVGSGMSLSSSIENKMNTISEIVLEEVVD